jgi:hypothetical protein
MVEAGIDALLLPYNYIASLFLKSHRKREKLFIIHVWVYLRGCAGFEEGIRDKAKGIRVKSGSGSSKRGLFKG